MVDLNPGRHLVVIIHLLILAENIDWDVFKYVVTPSNCIVTTKYALLTNLH